MIGKRRTHKDPVRPSVRETVLLRDLRVAGGCVAAFLDPEHQCRSRWGLPHFPGAIAELTLDHIQEGYGRLGARAKSDSAHLVSLCWGAHLHSGWATSHRPLLREYLERVERDAA